jgi:hypothetical protein
MPTDCTQNNSFLEQWKGARWSPPRSRAGDVRCGALLLGATNRAIDLIVRFANCFWDRRRPALIEHEVATLVGQRVFAIRIGL